MTHQAPPSFDATPDSVIRAVESAINDARKAQDDVGQVENPGFDNIVKKLAQTDYGYTTPVTIPSFLQHVSTSQELRDASSKAEVLSSEFSIESGMRKDLFEQVHKVFTQKPDLDAEDSKLLQKSYKDYIRNGLGLSDEKRDILKTYYKELSNLSTEFSRNLGEVSSGVWYSKEELDGVPQSVLDTYEEKDGKLLMEFKYPALWPVLKYAKNEMTRRRAYVGDQNKVPQNVDLFERAIYLRRKAADLLGYPTHADYVLEDRMAKSSQFVNDFLNDLRSKLTEKGREELDKLRGLKGDHETLYIWDYRYFDRMLVEKEYSVDQEKISEYFELENTYTAMLNMFSTIFSVRFEEIKEGKSVWHEDCKQFAVHEKENDGFIGWLYLDLHPRNGKYGHAANFNLRPGYTDANGTRVYPATALVCNFTKPSAKTPSLLKHDEVVTLFHELGHGVHDLVGKTKYSRFHGTNTARDFVECPSQLLENWCWSENELRQLSSHYQTKEKIPTDLVRQLIKTKHVNGALFNLRQLHFGIFDMTIHSETKVVDSTKLFNDLRKQIALTEDDGEVMRGQATFGHLMGGYDAGYYSYLFSQVFSADLWTTKFHASPMDPSVGLDYRQKILQRGGSRDEAWILKEFLGREPNNKAFLKELGVASAPKL